MSIYLNITDLMVFWAILSGLVALIYGLGYLCESDDCFSKRRPDVLAKRACRFWIAFALVVVFGSIAVVSQ